MVTQTAKAFVRRLGPGLITGAADDDPSGIATYSQAGSQFRFSLVWTLLITTPLMIGIQMLSARIGWVTGEGLAANINKTCPRWLTTALVGLLVVANTINIAADVAAMGEAVRLLDQARRGFRVVPPERLDERLELDRRGRAVPPPGQDTVDGGGHGLSRRSRAR